MLLLRLNLYEDNVNLNLLYVERASVALTNSIAAASLTATISLVAATRITAATLTATARPIAAATLAFAAASVTAIRQYARL